MDILVLVQDYPNEKRKYTMNFVHTRNIEYKKQGIDPVVLSFQATSSYEYDSIKVYCKNDFLEKFSGDVFDLVISHAPNVRNHIRFLKKNSSMYKHILMFFHGHEVMKMSKYYPKPYDFVKEEKLKKVLHDMYDDIKLKTMNNFIQSKIKENKLSMIFVSEWMRNVFIENVKLNEKVTLENSVVIPNSMNATFIQENYSPINEFKADFITIRPLDKSKYGVDIVVKLAEKHPDLTFHIYGKGKFFNHYHKPNNVKVFDTFMDPNQLAKTLNQYKSALMPTRLDAQGVMMCEIASYGMPIVTSDLSICKEMLNSFSNVFYLNNQSLDINLEDVLNEINHSKISLNTKIKFSFDNTIKKELDVIFSISKKLNKG